MAQLQLKSSSIIWNMDCIFHQENFHILYETLDYTIWKKIVLSIGEPIIISLRR
jgi:hypothetical protein